MSKRMYLEGVRDLLKEMVINGEKVAYVEGEVWGGFEGMFMKEEEGEGEMERGKEELIKGTQMERKKDVGEAAGNGVKELKLEGVMEAVPEFKVGVVGKPKEFELPEGDKRAKWEWLRERVLGDEECLKHVKEGKKVVFGVGNLDAEVFFCGEAPGAEEEVVGEPFVGKAGQLLTRIIQAMGLRREDVYIGNIMNWRPEMPTAYGNRPPTQEEMGYCLPYLKGQLEIVKPKVIVALGATAVNGLLGHDRTRKITEVRGKWLEFEGVPLMVTFHPSYLLRNNLNTTKRQVWEDMMLVMERVGMEVTEKQRGYFL